MTHLTDHRPADARVVPTLTRGLAWGAVAGAVSGALSVVPLVLRNGPVEALLIYPPLAAIPGAVVGLVVGAVTAVVLAGARPATVLRARELGALVALLLVGWTAFVVPLLGAWIAVLAAAAGAVVAPRISARRSDAGAAGGTGSPGSSRAPGR